MNSLRLRIFLMVFLVVVLAVGTVLFFASQGSQVAVYNFVGSSAARDQVVAARLLSQPPSSGGAPPTQFLVQRVGAALGAQVILIDRQGNVLADSTDTLQGQAVPLPPQWSVVSQTAPLVVDDKPAYVVMGYSGLPGSFSAGTIAVGAVPLTDTLMYFGPQTTDAANVFFTASGPACEPKTSLASTGAIQSCASVSGSGPAQLALDTINRSLLLAALAGGGVALLLTATLSRGIVGPVEALTLAAQRMEQGDLSQRVPVRARDEIGALSHAFNAMAEGLSVSEQLRRQMVNDIAHELRTPLTNIRGYLEAVRDGVVLPKPEVIDSLYEESLLLNRLVEDLQQLALAEAGQLRLKRQPVAIAEVAERALAALPPQSAGGPAVRLDLPGDLPAVDADPERLGQVLRNLVSNAQHHTPADGHITISAQARAGDVAITVSDTGAGIAPEHLPFVFERFYRADQARARSTGGAGLGLAIVKQIVEAHGGRVSVTSTLGAGAAFTFSLPVAAVQAA